MAKKRVSNQAFDLDALVQNNPEMARITRESTKQAEQTARNIVAADTEQINKALAKTGNLNREAALSRLQSISAWSDLAAECPGSDCAIACGAGCVGGCLIAPPLVGFGAAAGTAAGAGTTKALSFTAIALAR